MFSTDRNNNPVPITEESGNANSAAEEHDGGGGLTAAQQSEDERIMAKEALEAMKVIKQFTAEVIIVPQATRMPSFARY